MNNECITRKRTSKGHCTVAAEGRPQTLQEGLRGHHTPAQSRQGGATPPGRAWTTFSLCCFKQFSSVRQFSPSVVSHSLQSHGLQHARLPCPSPSPGACSNSCPSSQRCLPTISSSVVPFSSCLQSCPTSESFLMS